MQQSCQHITARLQVWLQHDRVRLFARLDAGPLLAVTVELEPHRNGRADHIRAGLTFLQRYPPPIKAFVGLDRLRTIDSLIGDDS